VRKRLGKLLHPGMGVYFFIMAAFCAAALLAEQYWLAALETTVTILIFMLYVAGRRQRELQIQQYLQTVSGSLEATSQGESPLPAVLVRLADGGIVWANHGFSELTGYADSMMEQQLEDLLPGFDTAWLAAGKTESPDNVLLAAAATGFTAPPSGPRITGRPCWACCTSAT